MLNTQREKKRFIAGAVCPECKALDTIVMYPDKLKVECTRCDYEEIMSDDGPQTQQQPSQQPSADEASVVRFVDATQKPS